MRDETLERLHYTVQVLRSAYPGELTYRELARGIAEITRDKRPAKRTMIRDLERLRRQGFSVSTRMRGKFQMIGLSPDKKSQAVPISDIQLLGLSLAQEMMEPLRGTVFWNGIRAFWNETMRAAPEETQRHFRRRRQQVLVRGTPAKSYSEKGGVLSTLYDAQLAHREIEIVYTKPGEEDEPRVVRPYCVAFYDGGIYIVAEDANKEAFRTFKLDRVTSATRRDTFFKRKSDFDAQAYFADSLSVFGHAPGGREKPKCVTARLLKAKAVSLLAERPLHPQQSIERDVRGEFILTIPSVYESEFVRSILPYQDEIEILTPKSCRQRMQRTLKKMLDTYR